MLKILFLALLLPNICVAATSLWEVSKNDHLLYLGGTIHMLKKEDYPLPVEYDMAFNKAEKVVFETDIDAGKSPEFGAKMTRMLSYAPGQSLDKDINKKTLSILSKYLTSREMSIEAVINLKPTMVVLLMTVMELNRLGMSGIGVDEYYYKKAKSASKAVGYFESIDEQLNFLLTMGVGHENELIRKTIADMDRMESMINAMKAAWLAGDESKLAELSLADMQRDYPDLYQTLLVERNNNWIPQIEKMLLSREVELVLVGALHLVGNEGLLHQLRAKGYQVKQFH